MAYPPAVGIASHQMGTLLYNCVPHCHEIIKFSQVQTSYYVHSSGSNPPIVKSTITQPQIHIQLVHTLTGHKKAIFGVPAIAISPDGQTLISGGKDDTEFRDFKTLAHLSGWFQFRFRACS